MPSESVARIPESLSAVDAGPLLCAGITTYNSLRHSGARAGDTVAVQGIGGLGHLALQYAAIPYTTIWDDGVLHGEPAATLLGRASTWPLGEGSPFPPPDPLLSPAAAGARRGSLLPS